MSRAREIIIPTHIPAEYWVSSDCQYASDRMTRRLIRELLDDERVRHLALDDDASSNSDNSDGAKLRAAAGATTSASQEPAIGNPAFTPQVQKIADLKAVFVPFIAKWGKEHIAGLPQCLTEEAVTELAAFCYLDALASVIERLQWQQELGEELWVRDSLPAAVPPVPNGLISVAEMQTFTPNHIPKGYWKSRWCECARAQIGCHVFTSIQADDRLQSLALQARSLGSTQPKRPSNRRNARRTVPPQNQNARQIQFNDEFENVVREYASALLEWTGELVGVVPAHLSMDAVNELAHFGVRDAWLLAAVTAKRL